MEQKNQTQVAEKKDHKQKLMNELNALETKVSIQRTKVINSLFRCKQGDLPSRIKKVNREIKRNVFITLHGSGKSDPVPARRLSGLGEDQERIFALRRELGV